MQSQHFLPLKFEVESKIYILHLCCSEFTQTYMVHVYSYCGPILRYRYMYMALCVQNLVVAGHLGR